MSFLCVFAALQVISCTPIPSHAIQIPSVKAGIHKEEDDAPPAHPEAVVLPRLPDATAADTMAAVATQALNAQSSSMQQAPAYAASLMQSGSKRKRSDSPNDIDMPDADAARGEAQHGQHAKQQPQRPKQQQHLDSGHAAHTGYVDIKPESAPSTQPLHQLAMHQALLEEERDDAAAAALSAEAAQQSSQQLGRPGTDSQTAGPGAGGRQQWGFQTSWGDKLGRVIQWCQSYIVRDHLVSELQVTDHSGAGVHALPTHLSSSRPQKNTSCTAEME